MSKTGNRWECWKCGKVMSAYGRAKHLEGHWRHGEVNRTWVEDKKYYGYWRYSAIRLVK